MMRRASTVVVDSGCVRLGVASLLKQHGFAVDEMTGKRIPEAATLVLKVDADGWHGSMDIASGALRSYLVVAVFDVRSLAVVANKPKLLNAARLVDDFVVRDTLPELPFRIVRLVDRASHAGFGDVWVDLEAREAWRGSAKLCLRPMEFDLLVIFIRRSEVVLSKRMLSMALLGHAAMSDSSLHYHISRLRREIERHGARLIWTVHKRGYVLRK